MYAKAEWPRGVVSPVNVVYEEHIGTYTNSYPQELGSTEIAFERENGLYFAGEEVRGSIIVQNRSPVPCSGLFAFYEGKGHAAFIIGDGDDAVTYTGSKIYDQHRRTLLGNVYETSVVFATDHRAPEPSFQFGAMVGDGILVIPHDTSLGQRLVVHVFNHVLSYPFPQVLVGSVLVDLDLLLSAGSEVSFTLLENNGTTRGNKDTAASMGSIVLSARMLNPDAASNNSNNHNSSVGSSTDAVCELRVHRVTTPRTVGGYRVYQICVETHCVPARHVSDPSAPLPQPVRSVTIPAGTVVFPFAFRIRPDAPGSAEQRGGEAAHIRYSITVTVDQGWKVNPYTCRVFTVLSPTPRPPRSLLRPVRYATPEPVKVTGKCCFPFWSLLGTLRFEMGLKRQVFAPGETLELTATLHNDTDSPLQATLALVCVTKLYAINSALDRFIVVEDYKWQHTESVDADTVWTFDGMQRGLRVPPVFPSFLGTRPGSMSGADRHQRGTLAESLARARAARSTANRTDTTAASATATKESGPGTKGGPTMVSPGAVAEPSAEAEADTTEPTVATMADPVTFTYAVRFSAKPPGQCVSYFYALLPIVISAAPPSVTALKEAALTHHDVPLDQPSPVGQLFLTLPPEEPGISSAGTSAQYATTATHREGGSGALGDPGTSSLPGAADGHPNVAPVPELRCQYVGHCAGAERVRERHPRTQLVETQADYMSFTWYHAGGGALV